MWTFKIKFSLKFIICKVNIYIKCGKKIKLKYFHRCLYPTEQLKYLYAYH